MKRKAQDTVIALLTSEHPAFGTLSASAKKALAETYRLRGPKAFQVAFEHLAVESLETGDELPHLFVRAHGKTVCANKDDGIVHKRGERCLQLERHLTEVGAS